MSIPLTENSTSPTDPEAAWTTSSILEVGGRVALLGLTGFWTLVQRSTCTDRCRTRGTPVLDTTRPESPESHRSHILDTRTENERQDRSMQSRVAVAASTAVRSVGIDPYADPPRVVPVSARDIASTSGVDET